MRLFKQLLTNNNCYTASVTFTPKGIMWHSTGANNPNLRRYVQPDDGRLGLNNNNNHWNLPKPDGVEKCVHAFIGKDKNGAVATYQTLPWTARGWHAGKAAGNDTYIGFEICEDSLVDVTYFNAVYKEACELTAFLCKMFNLDPMKDGVVICHSEGHKRGVASNHGDVMHWFSKHGKTMVDVRKDVKALMGNSGPASSDVPLYRVQCGSFKLIGNAKKMVEDLAAAGYDTIVVNVNGRYKVQCGAFRSNVNANNLVKELNNLGYSAFVTIGTGVPVDITTAPTQSSVDSIKAGDTVRINRGAKSYEGKSVNSNIYDKTYTVDQLKGDRAVLGLKSICTAFNIKDLTRV